MPNLELHYSRFGHDLVRADSSAVPALIRMAGAVMFSYFGHFFPLNPQTQRPAAVT